jgi:murein DD-endopeptidase MepM/ murein hydrolase activator NlpD
MIRVFPIAMSAKPQFAGSFGVPWGPGHVHQGNDIFAPAGSPVLAVDDGSVRQGDDPKGGLVAMLTTADRTRYYYAHLQSFVGASPRQVKAGEQIGMVGNSGNAAGKPPHLHFEVHPNGGTAVDPFPELKAAQDGASATTAPATHTIASSPQPLGASNSARRNGPAFFFLLGLWVLASARNHD